MAPYLRQLNPDAERDMIKACSRLAYSKIKSKFKKYKKRPETSSSSSSSATSSSSEYSSQCTSDEDIFEEKKKKKIAKKTTILQTPMSNDDQSRDPLELSDNSQSDY